MATASTLNALISIVADSRASLAGVGCVIEKVFEGGREKLAHLDIPIISLACIDLVDQGDSFTVL